jgi:hypothetical protein
MRSRAPPPPSLSPAAALLHGDGMLGDCNTHAFLTLSRRLAWFKMFQSLKSWTDLHPLASQPAAMAGTGVVRVEAVCGDRGMEGAG